MTNTLWLEPTNGSPAGATALMAAIALHIRQFVKPRGYPHYSSGRSAEISGSRSRGGVPI
ncbi:MAG: hypothetical protein HC925_04240 [Coleofasciculaceae cyanobacterium SM2_3_26]|nr:hypothetical protein [Coleofasciculaceae cyanobacterium SM2_3_26]